MFTVYKHTTPDGKVYIGCTSRKLNRRFRNGKGYTENPYFTSAIKEFGWENIKHEILYISSSKEDAENKEVEFIRLNRSDNRQFGYNIQKGGSRGEKHSFETKIKISESLRGAGNPRFGKHFPNQNYGKMTANYDKEKRRLSHLGQQPVNRVEVKQLFIDGLTVVGEYKSISEAAKATGICISGISRCIKEKRKTAGGYCWTR